MAYGFADIEAALARLHFVAPSRRSAFANRLKHLQRLGFPPGVNTGRGRAADYHPEHLVLLALALELITFGYTPERAKDAIEGSLASLAAGIYRATDFEDTIICNFRPQGLSDLQDRTHFEEQGPTLHCMTAGEAVDAMKFVAGAQFAGSRIALFSLSGVVSLCANLICWEDEDGCREAFFEGLNKWASEARSGNS